LAIIPEAFEYSDMLIRIFFSISILFFLCSFVGSPNLRYIYFGGFSLFSLTTLLTLFFADTTDKSSIIERVFSISLIVLLCLHSMISVYSSTSIKSIRRSKEKPTADRCE
jgi:hypothetical protein